MNIKKEELENMLTNILFEVKGIMEKKDALRSEDNKKKSVLWEAFVERMVVLQGRNKKYKFITDEMKDLDKFFDEVGIDGFE